MKASKFIFVAPIAACFSLMSRSTRIMGLSEISDRMMAVILNNHRNEGWFWCLSEGLAIKACSVHLLRAIHVFWICMALILIQGCAHDQRSSENSPGNGALEERLATARATEKVFSNGNKFTSVEYSGNLEPNIELECIPLSRATSEYNPPALYAASKRCIEKEKYFRALDLLHLGSDFAYYDIKRLADRSVRGARKVLMIETFDDLTSTQRKAMSVIGRLKQSNPEQVKLYCTEVKRIGAPTYEPGWAINHGVGVYDEPRDGHYLTNVDADKLWDSVLKNGCTAIKVKTVSAGETVGTIIEIIQEGNGDEFCVPKQRTMLDIAKDLSKYGTGPNGILTTPEMKLAFKELYPC